MANDRDAEIFQIVGGKARQEVAVDRVVAEGRFVLPETEVFEPGRDVHARLHSVSGIIACVSYSVKPAPIPECGSNSRLVSVTSECALDRFLAVTARS